MNVGLELREARETRGLSLDTLAATTRVRARILDAIERNDRTALPARPYARGFVASYAREIGLDPDRLVTRYFAQFDSADESATPAKPKTVAVDDSPERPRWVAVLAIVVLAIAAVLLLRRVDDLRAPEPQVVGTTGTAAPAPPTLPQPAVEKAAVRPDVASSAEILIRLEAVGPVWVSASADGTRVIYRLLQPGSVETIRARDEVALRIGDAGAVTISVNGRAPAVMGRAAEVRNLRITRSGLE